MGTKIQCKTVLHPFYSVNDVNSSVSNGACLRSHNERALRINQHYNSFLPRLPMNGYLEYEKEKVRQTILKQELTFRHQLQELHRLYSRQRDLMNDLKMMKELHKNPLSNVRETSRNDFLADLNEPIVVEESPVSASDPNPCRNVSLHHVHSVHRPERLSFDINADVQSDDHTEAELLKKKTIFGVVISDDNTDFNGGKIHTNDDISSVSSFKECSVLRFDSVNGMSREPLMENNGDDDVHSQADKESSKGSLPWFIRKPQHNPQQQISRAEHCYHLNLELLQNCSQQFFNQKQANTRPISTNACDQTKTDDVGNTANIKKIFGVPIFSYPNANGDKSCKNQLEKKGLDNYFCGIKNQIDLNLSVDEEEGPQVPCLPRAVVKIATTEIDLEAPAVLESGEKDSCLETEQDKPLQPLNEAMRQAAECIVSISSSSSSLSDPLNWFADLICSRPNNECMDEFELMTLELRDMKDGGGSCYEPTILEIQYDEEEEEETGPKRPRRGQQRRGRQKRDFQRDVLPSIESLSRDEVSEDILTFEELLKTTGSSWQSRMPHRKAPKNGRGRCRARTPTKQPLCTESKPVKTSLTGWGK